MLFPYNTLLENRGARDGREHTQPFQCLHKISTSIPSPLSSPSPLIKEPCFTHRVSIADGPSLSRACLPIRQNCGVKAFKAALYERQGGGAVHLLLGGVISKHVIETETSVIPRHNLFNTDIFTDGRQRHKPSYKCREEGKAPLLD